MADALTVDELRADFEHSKRMHLTRPRFSTEEIGTLFAEIDRLRAALAQQAPAALLVRDIANDLGVSALDVCNALRLMGYGQHSVNMAITPDAAGALTRHFGAAPRPAA